MPDSVSGIGRSCRSGSVGSGQSGDVGCQDNQFRSCAKAAGAAGCNRRFDQQIAIADLQGALRKPQQVGATAEIGDGVAAIRGVELKAVTPCAAGQQVIPGITAQRVCTAKTRQAVIAAGPGQQIGGTVACHHIVAGIAGPIDRGTAGQGQVFQPCPECPVDGALHRVDVTQCHSGFHDDIAGCFDHIGVAAFAAIGGIVAQTTGQRVIAGPSGQRVIAAIAKQRIVAAETVQQVGGAVATQHIVQIIAGAVGRNTAGQRQVFQPRPQGPVHPGHHCVGLCGDQPGFHDDIGIGIANVGVGPVTAGHGVATQAAIQHIGPGITGQLVIESRSGQVFKVEQCVTAKPGGLRPANRQRHGNGGICIDIRDCIGAAQTIQQIVAAVAGNGIVQPVAAPGPVAATEQLQIFQIGTEAIGKVGFDGIGPFTHQLGDEVGLGQNIGIIPGTAFQRRFQQRIIDPVDVGQEAVGIGARQVGGRGFKHDPVATQ